MEQKLDKKIEFTDRLFLFLKENKFKLLLLLGLLLIIFIGLILFKNFQEKKNILISEKYIQAGIYLASEERKKSKKIYEEIILSKNPFYSILSLNTILEKELEKDKDKILQYFEILQNSPISKDQKDLLIIKKALFLKKTKETNAGKNLLENLKNSNSNFKGLAEEILSK